MIDNFGLLLVVLGIVCCVDFVGVEFVCGLNFLGFANLLALLVVVWFCIYFVLFVFGLFEFLFGC